MEYYTVYVGGERRDRLTTDEDRRNVQRVLSLHTSGGCFTNLGIAQIEQVLDALVCISYIHGNDNLNRVIGMVISTGVSSYSVVSHGNDDECLNELKFTEYLV